MVEKNTVLTTRGKDGGTIILKPLTSIGNVEGLKPYLERRFNQFLEKINKIFVAQEPGKTLSSNDFSDKYREQLDNLKSENVTNISVNGQTVENINGTIEISTETLAPVLEDDEIEKIFNNSN